MDFTELSLGPSGFFVAERKTNLLLDSEENSSRKRKYQEQNIFKSTDSLMEMMSNISNSSTMMIKKNCNWSKQQKLDLDLNISSNSSERKRSTEIEDLRIDSSTNMVAMGCLKCNLLVMLSKSFPSCPNCKYVHSLPIDRQSSPSSWPKIAKPINTLSLLH